VISEYSGHGPGGMLIVMTGLAGIGPITMRVHHLESQCRL
jgi:hypothetical protein